MEWYGTGLEVSQETRNKHSQGVESSYTYDTMEL